MEEKEKENCSCYCHQAKAGEAFSCSGCIHCRGYQSGTTPPITN